MSSHGQESLDYFQYLRTKSLSTQWASGIGQRRAHPSEDSTSGFGRCHQSFSNGVPHTIPTRSQILLLQLLHDQSVLSSTWTKLHERIIEEPLLPHQLQLGHQAQYQFHEPQEDDYLLYFW